MWKGNRRLPDSGVTPLGMFPTGITYVDGAPLGVLVLLMHRTQSLSDPEEFETTYPETTASELEPDENRRFRK